MFSFTEMDTTQNYDSTSYISFSKTNDSLQHSCQYLCDPEGRGRYHQYCPSYHLAPGILSQEEDAPLEITLLQQQFLQIHDRFYEECH